MEDKDITNTTGEIMAVIQALMWAISTAERETILIHTDCDTVVKICAGDAVSKADADLAKLLRILFDTANGIAPVYVVHVPSHEGMPWNELVDGLSKRARKQYEDGADVDNIPWNFKDILRKSKYYQWENS